MKKLFSLLLALALACSLAAAPAWAEKEYGLTIAGTKVTDSNAADILGNGVFAYDAAAKTLSVNGSYEGTEGDLIINEIDGLTIRASADAQLTGAGAALETYGDLRLTGPGKLTVTGINGSGIIAWSGSSVTIEDVDLDVSGSWGITGMKTGGKLVFRNCTVHALGSANAVLGFNGGITFDGCEITGPEGVWFSGTNIVDKDNFVAGEVTIGKPKQVTSYELWIADKQVTSDNAADVLGDGAFAYDAASNRLSVKGDCNYDKAFVILNDIADLTVSVEKDAALSCPQDVIISQKNLTVTGPGRLTLKSIESCGLYAVSGATLTLDKADVDASGVWGIGGNSHGEKLVVRDSEIRAAGSEAAICDFDGGITLSGCEVTAPEGGKVSGSKIEDAGGSAKSVAIGKPPAVEYDLWVAGTQVTAANAADVLGDGAFAYDATAKKLTVRGSCACQYDPVINSEIPGLTVSAEQNVTLSSESDVINTYKDMTITGSGVLTLKSTGNSCIYARAGAMLTIVEAEIEAVGKWGIVGFPTGEKLAIRNSKVHAEGSENGAILDFDGGITLDGCAVTAPSGAKTDGGRITDADGKVAKDVTIAPASKPEKPVNPFVDIFETDEFYDAVLWAYYAKPQVTNGMDATHFGPMSTVTRGQAVTFLWRAMGEPEPTAKTNPFADVPESEYYYKAILWAVEKGVTMGTDATHFTPNQTCSTAHIITFLYRTLGIGTDGWYELAGAWAKDAGLLDGLTLQVAPEVDCPRADVVLFLYRQLGK